jgi:hypothetical protein
VVRVLFLGGLGRSGTTLLERVLGELPGIRPLGEVVHLWQRDVRDDERCGCGTRFSRCDFWRQVGDEAFGGWSTVDVDRILALRQAVERTRHIPRLAAPRLGAELHAQVTEYAGYYARLYRAAAKVSGASVLVDSSKHGALAYCLRWAEGIDLRVVHVVRDSRGVAYSWTKRVARPESDGADEMACYTPGRSALLWNAHNVAFGLLGRCGVPVRRVRYEEFVANPRGAIHALAAFAGLEESTVDLSFLGRQPDGAPNAELGPCHSAAGNPMRFTVGRVPLRHDDAWRRSLAPRQRRVVAALTAPLLGAYGYPLVTGGRA